VQRLRLKLGPAGPGLIVTRPPGYVLQLGEGGLDVREFGVLAARGRAAAGAGAWAQAAGLLREALGLWRGEALADVPCQLLREREVAPLEEERLQVLAARIGADLHLGRHGGVVGELRQLVAAYPLVERFHGQLMVGLYRSGRQGDALAAYQDARRVLAAGLGVDPGPELQLLHQQMLAADPGLLLAADGQPPATTPARISRPASPAATPSPPDGGTPGLPGPPGAAGPAGPSGPGATQAAPEPVAPRQLPVAARHFAGRTDALKMLAGLADEAGGTDGTGKAGRADGTGKAGRADAAGRAVVIAAIEGTAGIGKTALAVHFAHQVAGRFPDGQLYVNLRGFDPAGPPMPSGEAIRILLDALGMPPAKVPGGLEAQAGLYRSLLAGKQMLVLLDNARDVDQVRPLLPASPGCLVLVTSRSQLTSLVAAEGAYPLMLDVLTDVEARELLGRRLGPERLAAEAVATGELIGLCARLPLAGISRELGDRAGEADVHNALTVAYLEVGRDADALGHAQQALELFTAAGERPGQAAALNAVGWLHSRLGDHRQALVYCRQAIDLHKELDYPLLEAATWDSLGYAHHHLGDHAESAACYQRALDLRREIGDRWGQTEILRHIGEAHLAAGHPEEARAAWEEALAILDDLHHPDAGQLRAKLAELGADQRPAPGTRER
jgi:tetratricopeptide (TPR) repeat protein